MKSFLTKVSELIGQLDKEGKFQQQTLREMNVLYHNLTEDEKKKSIDLLSTAMEDDYKSYFYIMSALLVVTKSGIIVPYIEKMLVSDEVPLWERIGDMLQMGGTLFQYQFTDAGYIDRKRQKFVYDKILTDIKSELGVCYRYIPYCERARKVVIITNQLLGMAHAPTRKVVKISKYLESLGYEVLVYVCFHPWKTDGTNINWYNGCGFNNFLRETTYFKVNLGDTIIKGYNVCLNPKQYVRALRDAIGLLWSEKPEYILEIGEKTLLAGLCEEFTTLVTMSCTKSAPSTNAPIIARYFEYSKQEDEEFRFCIGETQKVIDVKHEIEEFCVENTEQKTRYRKNDFGIKEEQFVVLIAGNRLDSEISEVFLQIMYQMLDLDSKIVFAMIGNCENTKKKVLESGYQDKFFFLGYQQNFGKVIGIGDIFLNPPRQGGGTGAIYAMLENVPVITLDHCDVESFAGKEFVCESMEEMVDLVQKYLSEPEFMKQQKKNCWKKAEMYRQNNSVENFRKLGELVREVTLEKEGRNNGK